MDLKQQRRIRNSHEPVLLQDPDSNRNGNKYFFVKVSKV
jgi:hypothetical protein